MRAFDILLSHRGERNDGQEMLCVYCRGKRDNDETTNVPHYFQASRVPSLRHKKCIWGVVGEREGLVVKLNSKSYVQTPTLPDTTLSIV